MSVRTNFAWLNMSDVRQFTVRAISPEIIVALKKFMMFQKPSVVICTCTQGFIQDFC